MAASQREASAAETTASMSRCNVDAVAGVISPPPGPQPCSSQLLEPKVSTAANSLRLKAATRFAGSADPDAADRVRGTWSAPAVLGRRSSRRAEAATPRRPPSRQPASTQAAASQAGRALTAFSRWRARRGHPSFDGDRLGAHARGRLVRDEGPAICSSRPERRWRRVPA